MTSPARERQYPRNARVMMSSVKDARYTMNLFAGPSHVASDGWLLNAWPCTCSSSLISHKFWFTYYEMRVCFVANPTDVGLGDVESDSSDVMSTPALSPMF